MGHFSSKKWVKIRQKQQHANSQSAVEFIANRLQYRIKDSVIARTSINAAALVPIADASGNTFRVLEWIGVDNDGFRSNSLPNWSGIIDIDLSNTNNLNSAGTNLTNENTLIKILSNNNSDINDSTLYFMGSNSDIQSGYGWNGQINNQNQTMHPINSNGNLFAPAVGNFHDATEYYQLAWSAYAIELNTTSNELFFYHNFQPWNGDVATNGTKTLLMEHVSIFQFRSAGSIMKIQICTKSTVLDKDGGDYSLCKEKTIF